MLAPPASSFRKFCNYLPKGDPTMLDQHETRIAKPGNQNFILMAFLSKFKGNQLLHMSNSATPQIIFKKKIMVYVGISATGDYLVTNPSASLNRWVKSAYMIPSVFLKQSDPQNYVWRRLQVSNQQAERQKKSILQMCMAFHNRATRILQDPPNGEL